MTLSKGIHERIRPGRVIEGCSAVLLPFTPEGAIDEAGFQRLLAATVEDGLIPAVNMDTGYVNLLGEDERKQILALTHGVMAGKPFIAGAFVQGKMGDVTALYREQITMIQAAGGTPIIFPCDAMKALDRVGLVRLFRELGQVAPRFLGFELGEMFVPFGRIFDLDTLSELMQIPALVGIKHSSLDREQEWQRLALRDRQRPDFKIYTGNDLAIDMVMYGSDYLLGLSAFHPAAFALRDKLWALNDPGFYMMNDLLQYLGFLAFRAPVPGYKHNVAQFLKLRGVIGSSMPHPKAISRPDSDLALLSDILNRLDAAMACISSKS